MIIKTKNIIQEATNKISELLRKELEKKETIVFGIVGGRSADAILSNLSKQKIDWNRIHFFLVDEREVPITDDESNFKILSKYFSEKFSKNLHPYYYEKKTNRYYKELKKYGGKFDVIFLSSGEDGHIGALYPNHYSIKNNSQGFIRMNDSPKMPKKRMTITKKLLLKTNSVVLLFSGEQKKQAFNNFVNKKITQIHCPAKLVLKIKKNFVFTDTQE